MKILEDILKEEFPQAKIVRLGDITKKIAGISKVRLGKNRTYTNYDEISLNNIDEYGIVFIPDNPKELGPAYIGAIESQSLNPGDIVLTQRGTVGKVGLIGENYKRVIVGNNSMIRIQFDKKSREDLPAYVQAYLQLPLIREYFNIQLSCSISDRKILSAQWLSDLPIPIFDQDAEFDFRELIYNRIELLEEAKRVMQEAQKMVEMCEDMKHKCVSLQVNKADELGAISAKDRNVLLKLSELREELKSLHAL